MLQIQLGNILFLANQRLVCITMITRQAGQDSMMKYNTAQQKMAPQQKKIKSMASGTSEKLLIELQDCIRCPNKLPIEVY